MCCFRAYVVSVEHSVQMYWPHLKYSKISLPGSRTPHGVFFYLFLRYRNNMWCVQAKSHYAQYLPLPILFPQHFLFFSEHFFKRTRLINQRTLIEHDGRELLPQNVEL